MIPRWDHPCYTDWRKTILFNKGLKLHAKTKAEVLLVIDHKGQRFVSGSQGLLECYNKGLLQSTQTAKKYHDMEISSDYSESEVVPVEDTPEHLRLHQWLEGVLGHSSAQDDGIIPPSRKRLPFSADAIPVPVHAWSLNRPTPQLTDKDKDNIPLHPEAK